MKQLVQIRKEAPVGIVARTVDGITVPIIYSARQNIEWPYPIRREQIGMVIKIVRAAIVSPFPVGDARVIATALDIPANEAERVLRFLSPDVGLEPYLKTIRRLESMGISPSKMPWRYVVPMIVSEYGDKAADVIQHALSFLPESIRPRSFGGNAGARDLAALIIRIWEATNGQE